jgi:hypothetical protein
MAVAIKPSAQILVKVVTGGALATATVVFSIDGGKTYTATPTLTAATVMVPNASFVTLAFVGAGGTSFITGDIWTVATTGTCTLTSGTGVGTVSLSSACPVDAYTVIFTIWYGGALGTATFTYSMDGGNTVSGTIVTPGSGIYVIPDTGLQVTFAGTLTAGDTYSFTTTTASYTGTDLTNAWNALVADPRQWFHGAHRRRCLDSVAQRCHARRHRRDALHDRRRPTSASSARCSRCRATPTPTRSRPSTRPSPRTSMRAPATTRPPRP